MSDDPFLFRGGRAVSWAGLLEQIEEEFNAETIDRPDLIPDEASRRTLISDIANYIMTTSGIKLSKEDRLAVLEQAYRDLFGFAPLDGLVNDWGITEILIQGYDRLSVRTGMGDMKPMPTLFQDASQVERFTDRLLALAGTSLKLALPFVEVGVLLADRPARLTVTGAPISPILTVNIRLHPLIPHGLTDLERSGVITHEAVGVLQALLAQRRGLMIAGDAASGKTTLLQALLPLIADSTGMVCVERAAELRLSDGVRRLTAIPPGRETPGRDFPEVLSASLGEANLKRLILDEVRFDESAALWAALSDPQQPHLIACFQGATDPLRLRTAFNMAIRRSQQGIEQALLNDALHSRLPCVALMGRLGGSPSDNNPFSTKGMGVVLIGEWVVDGDSLRLQTLWKRGDPH